MLGRSADEIVAPAWLKLEGPWDGAESSECECEEVWLVGGVAHGHDFGVGVADHTPLEVGARDVVHHVLLG